MIIRNREFDFDRQTYIMGILNVTPDSFSDGGSHNETEAAIAHAMKMIEEGATIIDIGGESTRPGFSPVSAEDELERVIPVIKGIREKSDIVISIDTTKAVVAKEAINAGADIINDVSGFLLDTDMARIAVETEAVCIFMHDGMYFENSKEDTKNNDFPTSCSSSYMNKLTFELKTITDKAVSQGVSAERIIIDPGVGFGKTLEENLCIIKRLECLKGKYPILLGCSRKSVIGKTLNVTVDKRLEGTIVTSIMGAQKGAGILRVHDVLENKRAVDMFKAIDEVLI